MKVLLRALSIVRPELLALVAAIGFFAIACIAAVPGPENAWRLTLREPLSYSVLALAAVFLIAAILLVLAQSAARGSSSRKSPAASKEEQLGFDERVLLACGRLSHTQKYLMHYLYNKFAAVSEVLVVEDQNPGVVGNASELYFRLRALKGERLLESKPRAGGRVTVVVKRPDVGLVLMRNTDVLS